MTQHPHKKTAAILVAAGRGSRAGGDVPKQWRVVGQGPQSADVAAKRVIDHTINAFRPLVDLIVVVHHPDDAAFAASLTDVRCVHGGASRSQSVKNGLQALDPEIFSKVLIHDAARAFVPQEVISEVIDALDYAPAAAPGLPVTDALWRAAEDHVTGVQDRTGLTRAQTPQGFHLTPIYEAHQSATAEAADDVEIARAAGINVRITQGSEDNFKITHPEDFQRAERLLASRHTNKGSSDMDIRLGNGYDVHRFGEGDHVWLCGVKVAHNRSLQGHSDADVGMHALTDAIYGALAEGDIGQHFPPSDMQWKGAESHIFLRHAIDLARQKGYEMSNCDVTLICERPKIGPRAHEMRAALADIMTVDLSKISVKATTSERLGFTGREEGIAAQATACLIKY